MRKSRAKHAKQATAVVLKNDTSGSASPSLGVKRALAV